MLNGIILILLFLAYVLIAIGSGSFHARLIGACLNCWVSVAHVGAILVTGFYIFSPAGRLAANCKDNSFYGGDLKDSEPMGDDWTFKKDADLIMGIWICQFFIVYVLCCYGSLPLRTGGVNKR